MAKTLRIVIVHNKSTLELRVALNPMGLEAAEAHNVAVQITGSERRRFFQIFRIFNVDWTAAVVVADDFATIEFKSIPSVVHVVAEDFRVEENIVVEARNLNIVID